MILKKRRPERRDFRAQVPPVLVRDLALWQADGLEPGTSLAPADLGRPLMRQGASRAYGLHLTDLSASGLGLHIHNSRLGEATARAMAGHRFLVRLELGDQAEGEATTLLLLAGVRRSEPRRGGARLALEFTARARWMQSAGTLQLAPVRGRGVDALASWVARPPSPDAEANPAPPRAENPAWYESLG